MATPNPGEPPINAPVTDDKGNMTVPWHLWCVMMWKKIGGGGSLSAAWGTITGLLSSQTDLQAALNAKQASLGFTPENVANKTIDGTLGTNSDILYPSEKAVKTYVDGHSSAVPTGTGFRHVTSGAEDAAAAKVAIDTTADTSMTDVTTNNVSITKHGFAPKSPNDATKFLDGTGAYSVPAGTGTGTVTHTPGALTAHAVVVGNGSDDEKVLAALGTSGQYLRSGGAGVDPAFAAPTDAELSTSDITTNDVSITKHGFAPKAPNDSTKFLNGVGAYAVPTGTGTGTVTHTAGALDAHKVVIGNGTDDVKVIATGTAGQYLRSGGASADPAMASIAESEVTNLVSDLAAKADLASPTFTGTPKAPTPLTTDNNTNIATTAYVQAQGYVTSGGGGSALASGPYLKLSSVYYIGPAMHVCSLPDTTGTGFAWQNQSGSTIAAQSGAYLLTGTSGSGMSAFTKSIGANTSLIVAFIPTAYISNASQNIEMGICFFESGSGKLTTLSIISRGFSGNDSFLTMDRWSGSGTTFVSSPVSGIYSPFMQVTYLRLQVSGSNLIYSVSSDGINFQKVLTEAKTVGFTTAPDKWGYSISNPSANPAYALYLSWEEA